MILIKNILVIINNIFIWIGHPNNCLRQVGGRTENKKNTDMPFLENVCFCQKLTIFVNILQYLFIFDQYWGPHIPFTAEQAAAGAVFFLTTCHFSEMRVLANKTGNNS